MNSPVNPCPFCGEVHPEGSRFCPRTGRSIPQPPQHKKKIPVWPWLLAAAGLLVIALGIFLVLRENWPASQPNEVGGADKKPFATPAQEKKDVELEAPGIAAATSAAPIEAPPLPTEAPQAAPPQPTDTPPPTATLPPTATPPPTAAPPPTATPTPAPTATQAFEIAVNEKDSASMVWVPPGEFIMGSDPAADPYFWGAEAPTHTVTLSGYWIYQYEVTNAMYAACVDEKACPIPEQVKSRTRKSYYNDPQFASYPVVYVDWTSAQSYCRWAGGGLPTEAQWEKAARGEDGRLFPWGQTLDAGNVANLCDSNCPTSPNDPGIDDTFRDTAPVGSFPNGRSPYGLYDAAGNAWEWVFDWFQETYYQVSPLEDPPGPNGGKYRVIRGGSFDNATAGQRAVVRYAVRPDIGLDTVGFRCAVQER